MHIKFVCDMKETLSDPLMSWVIQIKRVTEIFHSKWILIPGMNGNF